MLVLKEEGIVNNLFYVFNLEYILFIKYVINCFFDYYFINFLCIYCILVFIDLCKFVFFCFFS